MSKKTLFSWGVGVLILWGCVALVLLISKAFGQAVIPFSRMGLTQDQIMACSHLFSKEEKVVTCKDLKGVWVKNCKDAKPEKEVDNPWD